MLDKLLIIASSFIFGLIFFYKINNISFASGHYFPFSKKYEKLVLNTFEHDARRAGKRYLTIILSRDRQ